MFKDDEEEEENTFGVTRYPCMPSLVALQQMRNRLHLAFLGRKLMKWTALATGREMRKLAGELYDVYQGFGEDMRNAFIMLARARYFCPQLNYIVTEDICKKAGVVVQQNAKSISGVKIVQFEIFETEYPPYAHLGIEKGGQAILEAKKAWLDLLKRLIMMMQLRASFLMVELANKNATKKMNVLAKVVIPRTNVTMEYINNELEEYAREEFFRLKKVLEIKRKMYGGNDKDKKKPVQDDSKLTEVPKPLENIRCPEVSREVSEIPTVSELPKDYNNCPSCRDIDIVKFIPCICEDIQHSDEISVAEYDILTPSSPSPTQAGKSQEEIDKLIKKISELIDKTTDMDEKGFLNASIDEFIKTAEILKLKLGQKPEEEIKEDTDSLPRKNVSDNIDKKTLCDVCNNEMKDIQLSDDENEGSLDIIEDESGSELGIFETEVKEITKISRTINDDGTITVTKKVIKIEKEIKTPNRSKPSSSKTSANKPNPKTQFSYSSTQSSPYSGSRTIGLVTFKGPETNENFPKTKLVRKAKSEVLQSLPPMSDPAVRFSISTVSLLSTDLDTDHETGHKLLLGSRFLDFSMTQA